MRDRLLVSGGHALIAMCAFIWLYSMALAWTPDAGHSAPNSLLCGVGVFAAAFLVSQTRMRVRERRVATLPGAITAPEALERVVLDGSIPALTGGDGMITPRPGDAPRAPLRDWREEPRAGDGPAA